ncbi:MAG: hypothetical protein D6748_10185 [Calditrichaeota bacterium]|nr:MAG: hypothetical protein D6748_10185 [Calditrichota bacterium]
MHKKNFLCQLLWILCLSLLPLKAQTSMVFNNLAIELNPDKSVPFVFSNKDGAFWNGHSSKENQSNQGYRLYNKLILNDYRIYRNGSLLQRNSAKKISLYPDHLQREYDGIEENFFFIDSLPALMIQLKAQKPEDLYVEFQLDRWFDQLQWGWDADKQMAFAQIALEEGTSPGWLGVYAFGEFDRTALIKSLDKPKPVSTLTGTTNIYLRVTNAQKVFVLYLYGKDKEYLIKTFLRVSADPEKLLTIRRKRIKSLLSSSSIETNFPFFDKAYAWAKISLDDLIPYGNQGVWRGLPDFPLVNGRETFLSFTSAYLLPGHFDAAREVLLRFARLQNSDLNSPYYGRIPQTVESTARDFSAADVTPLFVKACEDYVNYSGDLEFVNSIFPVIKKAMDGTITYHLDEFGFLLHGDDETWMNARSLHGPWAPRGNKAVEIQALWMEQVRISRKWAEWLGYKDWAEDWKLLEDRLRLNFVQYFVRFQEHIIVDHLKAGNQPVEELRPNCLFALTYPQNPLFTPEQKAAILEKVAQELVFPWGVATLSQNHPEFRPYSYYAPYYSPASAMYNGIIWKWLTGPLIRLLADYHPGFMTQVLKRTVEEMFSYGAPGTLPERRDVWPYQKISGMDTHLSTENANTGEVNPDNDKKEFPRLAGPLSSAPALASFIQNWHQDIIGFKPQLFEKKLMITPRLPVELPEMSFSFPLGKSKITGRYLHQKERFLIEMQSDPHLPDITVTFSVPFNGKWVSFDIPWKGKKRLQIEIRKGKKGATASVNGRLVEHVQETAAPEVEKLTFAKPALDFSIKSLQLPQYQVIPGEEATRKHGRFTPLLFDIKDPKHDDTGPNGKYTYPLHSDFKPGIFDVRRVRIRQDKEYLYFEIDFQKLVNSTNRKIPGFEHTFLAITLSYEKYSGVRSTKIERNANFSVPYEYAFNFVVYVGNGYVVTDARDNVLAVYRPQPEDHPIASIRKKKLQFSIPLKVLTTKFLKNAVVLSGGRDDSSGGKDVGEFRAVRKEADLLHGGGGDEAVNNPNIYDVVYIRR